MRTANIVTFAKLIDAVVDRKAYKIHSITVEDPYVSRSNIRIKLWDKATNAPLPYFLVYTRDGNLMRDTGDRWEMVLTAEEINIDQFDEQV